MAMKTITKMDFVSSVASEMGVSKAQASKFVDVFFEKVADYVANGDKVAFTGYASFQPSQRKARKGRNPATGKEINIPAKTVVKIKAGKKLQCCGNCKKRK